MDMQTQKYVIIAAVVGAIILQLGALIILGVMAILRDGEAAQGIISALELYLGVNVVSGGGVAIAHILKGQPATAMGVPVSSPIPAQEATAQQNGPSGGVS